MINIAWVGIAVCIFLLLVLLGLDIVDNWDRWL